MSFLSHLEELRWHLVRSAAAIFLLGIVFFAFAEEVYNNFLLAHIQPDFITYQLFCDFFRFFGFESDFCTINFADKKLQSIKVTSQLMNSHLDFIYFRSYCCISLYFMGVLAIYFTRFT